MTCLFCSICQGKIPANIVLETDTLLAFQDIKPQAPVHILIIPKKHIETIDDVVSEDAMLIGQMTLAAQAIARTAGLQDDGYRLVFNVKKLGGQEVFHIHLHLLGGRQMSWPPG